MKKFYFLSIVLAVLFNSGYSQTDTEFWFCVPEVSHLVPTKSGEEATYVHMTTLAAEATVIIDMPANPGFPVQTYDIPANSTRSLDLTPYIRNGANPGTPDDANIIETGLPGEEGVVTNKGFRIRSSKLITAYLLKDNAENGDIFSLKGVNALGNEFYIPNQNYFSNYVIGAAPAALNSFDIVATENVTIFVESPVPIKGRGTNFSVPLIQGQTISCVAMDEMAASHFKGAHVYTDGGNVAVMLKEDALLSDIPKDETYSMAGDQLIPINYAGDEYIVMRGQMGLNPAGGPGKDCREYVFVLAIEPNTTIEFSDENGFAPAPVTLANVGDIAKVLINNQAIGMIDVAPAGNIDALHIKSTGGEPFLVYHISGFQAQISGAILPTIKGCSGSSDVSFVADNASFYFTNIMCKTEYINDFIFERSEDGVLITQDAVDPSWFIEIPGTGWSYIDKDENNFRLQYGIQSGEVIRIYNTQGVFHFGVIYGDNSGSRYGYFSDFGGGGIVAAVDDLEENNVFKITCFGDTVQLQAGGGLNYTWRIDGADPLATFIDTNTISSPRVIPNTGPNTYWVKTDFSCSTAGTGSSDSLQVLVVSYPDLIADFSIHAPLSDCSPYGIKLENTTTVSGVPNFTDTYMQWTIENDKGILDTSTVHVDTFLYSNTGYIDQFYDITLNTGYGSSTSALSCPEDTTMTVKVSPQIIANGIASKSTGCNRVIDYIGETDTSLHLSPWSVLYWDWGDGTRFDSLRSSLDGELHPFQFPHTYINNSYFDSTYIIKVGYVDTLCFCSDTTDVDTVFIPGKATASFSLLPQVTGCSPLEVNIKDNSSGNIRYEWSISDDASMNPPIVSTTPKLDTTVVFINQTDQPIKRYVFLRVFKEGVDHRGIPYSCEYTFGPDSITIYPEFNTTITPVGGLEGCQPFTTSFTQTTVENVPNLQYYWDFGNGTSSGEPGNPTPVDVTYINETNSEIDYQVSLITTSQYNCKDTAPPVNVTVYSYIDAQFTVSPDTSGCSPYNVSLGNNTSVNADVQTEIWTDNGTPFVPASNPFTLNYVNLNGVDEVHEIILTNSNGHATCDVSFSKDIVVHPEITAQFNTSAATICNKESITFTNSSVFTGVSTPITGSSHTYLWDFGDGTSSSDEITTHVFTNTENNGTTAQQFTVTLTITVNGCSQSVQQNVLVYPEIVPQFNSDKYWACSPEDIDITNATIGADSYVWQFSDGSADITSTDVLPHNFTNPSLNDTASTTVTLIATNDMCSSSIQKQYLVYPALVPDFSPNTTAICAPDLVTFTNTSSGGDLTYLWDFNDGTPTSSDENPVHEFVNRDAIDVTRTVELTITNVVGCSSSITDDIIVSPEVNADFVFTIPTPACYPADVPFENRSLNGTDFVWDMGDGTTYTDITPPDHEFSTTNVSTSEIFTIRLTATGNYNSVCTDYTEKQIEVSPDIIADFSIVNDIGCSPWTSTFVNNSTGYNLNYIWDYKDDNYSSEQNDHDHTFKNLSPSTKEYDVTLLLTDGNGCTASHKDTVTVYPEVVADFTFLKDGTCTPFPVTFDYPATALNGTEFTWNFDDGNGDVVYTDRTPFEYIFDNTNPDPEHIEVYTISLHSEDAATGCFDDTVKSVEVYPHLVPGFIPSPIEVCDSSTIQFTNTTTGRANYNWDFKDGQSSAEIHPEHLFFHLNSDNDVTYDVLLTTTQENTGCSKTVEETVTVFSYVRAQFGLAKQDGAKGTKANVIGGCHPFTVEIVDSSLTNNPDGWRWDFGNGTSSDDDPAERTFTHDGSIGTTTYDIDLIVSNNHRGCQKSASTKVEVYAIPAPDFNVENEGCHPHEVSFADAGSVDEGTNYFWTLGDGSSKVVTDFDYTYSNYSNITDSVYTVNLTTTSPYGCDSSVTQTVTVHPKPLANFVPDLDRDCPPFETSLVNSSNGSNVSYFWDFDNGETKELSQITTEHPIYYNNSSEDEILQMNPSLRVVSEFGCEDTVIVPIYVFPAVLVGFEPSIRTGCSPLKVDFVNLSNRSAKVFTWNFGDGNTSGLKHPSHTYFNESASDQTHVVNLYAESEHGCSNERSDTITVYLTPVVEFDAQDPVQEYPDDSVWFTNLTQPGPWTYDWDFGDGHHSNTTDHNFLYTYGTWAPNENNNTFVVTLNVSSDHCSGTKSHNVQILPPLPTLTINQVTPGDGCVPLSVYFDITSEYAHDDGFYWEFGDDETSTEAEPIHIFKEPGVYNVKLTATGDGGAWFDYATVAVYALPEPDFKVNPDFVMLPDQEIHIYNLTLNGGSYIWHFGDGETSTEFEPNHQYTAEGSYDITLIAKSDEGCVDSLTQSAAAYVSGEGSIDFPNAFLPNEMSPSDGSYATPDVTNDVFHPIHEQISRYELWIFNRWGEQVFYSDDIEKGWNGKMNNNGKRLGQDVYFWKSKGKYQNGVPFKMAGDVTLIIR